MQCKQQKPGFGRRRRGCVVYHYANSLAVDEERDELGEGLLSAGGDVPYIHSLRSPTICIFSTSCLFSAGLGEKKRGRIKVYKEPIEAERSKQGTCGFSGRGALRHLLHLYSFLRKILCVSFSFTRSRLRYLLYARISRGVHNRFKSASLSTTLFSILKQQHLSLSLSSFALYCSPHSLGALKSKVYSKISAGFQEEWALIRGFVVSSFFSLLVYAW